MKLLFIVRGAEIELHLYARSEKEAIAKANKIAPRENYSVHRVFQQDDELNRIGVLEDLIDAVRNIELKHIDSINSNSHNPPNTSQKPIFHVIVDDRAVRYEGQTAEELYLDIQNVLGGAYD
jgi:hypothetical protein